jgi:hypothetical protein
MSFALAIPAFAQTNINADINTDGANINANANVNTQQGEQDNQDNQQPQPQKGMHGGQEWMNGKGGMMRPAVVGTVSAVSGTTITVNSKQGPKASAATSTTFTIDARNAVVKKNNATSTVSSIAVGDMIVVQGTVTGNNVVATMIRDGVMMRGAFGNKQNDGSDTPQIQGNGQPVIAGTISSISSSTVVVSNKAGATYSVDATNAKIQQKGNQSASISSLKVGDSVVVQGAVNGNNIVATTIIDGQVNAGENSSQSHLSNLFSGIGRFFRSLFGF